jgi:MFS transporter, DHA1 family, tetracycline resistance protein
VRLSVIFLLLTVMLDAMGIGLIMPIMPDLIREVEGGDLSQAALWGGVLSTIFAVMQFLFSPLLGNLSDAFGRRPVLLVSLAVMTLDYLVMAVAGSIWVLLIGRIVGGIAAATHATASACMADLSRSEDKAANFGLIGAAFGVGFVLGPLVGGLLGEMGTRAPFYAAAVLVGLNFLLGLAVMNETVTERIRRRFELRGSNPFAAFGQITRVPGLTRLMAVYFIYSVALYVYPAIWSYYTQAKFGWTAQVIGLSLAIFGLTMALVQGGLIRVFLHRYGEARTVIVGHVFDASAFGLLAVVSSGAIALILTPVAAMGAMVTPALQGMMSKAVPDESQGILQGVMTSVHALSMIVSPLLMASVFAIFTRDGAPVDFPGAPFLLSMLLVLSSLALFLRRSDPI